MSMRKLLYLVLRFLRIFCGSFMIFLGLFLSRFFRVRVLVLRWLVLYRICFMWKLVDHLQSLTNHLVSLSHHASFRDFKLLQLLLGLVVFFLMQNLGQHYISCMKRLILVQVLYWLGRFWLILCFLIRWYRFCTCWIEIGSFRVFP